MQRRLRHLCLAALLLHLLTSIGVSAAIAAPEPPLTLSVTPTTLTPRAGAIDPLGAAMVVVARPAKGIRVQDPVLHFVAGHGVRATITDKSATGSAATTDDLTWVVRVETSTEAVESPLLLMLDYRTSDAGSDKGRSLSEVATVIVKPAPQPRPSDMVEVTLQKDFDTLFDQQRGRAYLRMRNLTGAELTVVGVTYFRPAFLKVEAEGAPWAIPAHSTLVRPLGISFPDTPGEPVVAGNHLLGAVLSLAQRSGDMAWSGTLAVDTTIPIGVPGMSEIPSLIQVPSFLLLPGVLTVLLAASLLQLAAKWKWGAGRVFAILPLPDLTAQARSPVFWAWSIIVSLLISVVFYPTFTRWALGEPRDILQGIGFIDIYQVCGLSLLTAFAVLVFFVVINFICGRYQDHQARKRAFTEGEDAHKRTFTEDDDPMTVLERLALRKERMRLPCDGDRPPNFRLAEAGDDKVWAIPLAHVLLQGEHKLDGLDELYEAGDAQKVLDTLRDAQRAGKITVKWDVNNKNRGPHRVTVSTNFPEVRSFIATTR